MRWNITTLSQIEKLGRVIEFSCGGCDRRQAFTVADLVREYGGYSLPRDAAKELFTGCPQLAPARGILRCPYVFALLEPLKRLDCPDEIYIICGRRTVYGKPECRETSDAVSQRQDGEIRKEVRCRQAPGHDGEGSAGEAQAGA